MINKNKGENKWGWAGTLPGWIIAVLAIVAFFNYFVDLPNKNDFENMAQSFKDTVIRATQETTQQLIQFQIDYERNPIEARNNIFKEAFRQAEEHGYVMREVQGYRIADKYTQENNDLLTYFETQLIGEVLTANEDTDRMDLLELTLSEFRERSVELERDIETHDYGLVYLSPFDKIAVIGAYSDMQKMF